MFAATYANYSTLRNKVWSWSATTGVIIARLIASPYTTYLYDPFTGAPITTLTDFPLSSSGTTGQVMGSITGNKVFIVNTSGAGAHQGDMWIGTSGGVSYKATWQNAVRIHDANKAGGGALVATVSTAGSGDEPVRISLDGTGSAASWEQQTGNFWSVASGTQTFVGSGLVYA